MRSAYLKITTWADSAVVYATHYYGKLVFGEEEVEVLYKLSKAEAKKLTEGEQYRMIPSEIKYRTGEKSGRFMDRGKLLSCAIKLFMQDKRGYDTLLVGDSAICDPLEMIAGPKKVMEEANVLYQEFEALDGWACEKEDESKVQSICDEWDVVVGGPPWERE